MHGPAFVISSSGAPPPRDSQPITNGSPRCAALSTAGRTATKSASADLAHAGEGIVKIRYHGPAEMRPEPADAPLKPADAPPKPADAPLKPADARTESGDVPPNLADGPLKPGDALAKRDGISPEPGAMSLEPDDVLTMRAYQSADGSATGSTLCMSPERRLNRAIMLLCGPQALPDPQLCTVECCSGARNVHFLQQLDPAGLSGSCAEGRGPRPTRPVHDHGTFSRLCTRR